MNLSFSFAVETQAQEISELVNSAYRGDSSKKGWTTEADILDGQRTDPNEIRNKIKEKNSYIILAHLNDQLVGSCELQINPKKSELYFGMFTIKPSLQNQGLGKQFLNYVEKTADEWKIKKIKMTVITLRTELIDFYKRRGYLETEVVIPFPTEERFGIPKVSELKMVYLAKVVHTGAL